MANFGRFEIPLFRVWDVKRQVYIFGLIGSKTHIRSALADWIANSDGEQKRRNFRIVPVKIEANTFQGELNVHIV